MWSRAELKARAKAILKLSYWKAFLVSLIIAVVGGDSGGFNFNWNSNSNQHQGFTENFQGIGAEIIPYIVAISMAVLFAVTIALAFRILLGYALEVGGRRYFIQSTQKNFDLNALGFAFDKERYWDIIKAMLWRGILNFLWYLLLIIPGIIKSYAYRMVPYILADNPKIGYRRALELSTQMTDGEKLDMFVLDLSFLGWYILGAIAFLIGTLFVLPYDYATKAELYLILREKAITMGKCTPEELKLNVE